MDLFKGAKAVRLRSHHEKYLVAADDDEHVSLDRSGSSPSARWTVEISSSSVLRFKSCHGRYLTASNEPFLLGMTGRKVLQTLPHRLDSSVEWEPIREGFQVKLKTRYGQFLRANGGLPPWRNSVTHDIPHRTATQDWVLWDLDVVDLHVHMSPARPVSTITSDDRASSISSSGSTPSMSPKLSKQESSSSLPSSPHKVDGRTIYYSIGDKNGNTDEDGSVQETSFTFKGTKLSELTERIKEETGMQDIIVCSRNLLNQKLYPLRLHLPPNNTTMHVVVVEASSKEIQKIKEIGKEPILEDSNFQNEERSSFPALDSQFLESAQRIEHLQCKLLEASATIKAKELRIHELEGTVRRTSFPNTVTGSADMLPLEDDRACLELEFEGLFKQRIESEIEYFITTEASRSCRVSARDQSALFDAQKSLAVDQTRIMLSLQKAENKAVVLEEKAKELEARCQQLLAAEEVLKLQNNVCKLSLSCFVQLVVLCLAFWLFLLQLLPPSGGFVPT